MSDQVPTGRADITWGVISAGYDITDHFAFTVGLASYQPAMNSRYTSLRAFLTTISRAATPTTTPRCSWV